MGPSAYVWMPTSLEGKIRARIRDEGPVPFCWFMETALYDDEQGYYAKASFTTGREGDFATAPDTGPLLGATLAEAVASFAEEPGRLIEVGPGSGRLMQDLLTTLDPDAVGKLEVVLVERHEQREEALAERFEDAPGQVRIIDEIGELGPARSFLLANEVLDALPCEVLQRTDVGWDRLYVDFKEGSFIEHWEPASDELVERLAPLQDLPVGNRYETAPSLRSFMESIEQALDPGLALLMDYGDTFEHVWPRRPDGTLRGFHDHAHASPLMHPGRTDITYDVDFSRVQRIAEHTGLNVASFGAQERLLVHLGLMRIAKEQDDLLTAKQLLMPATGFGARFKTLVLDHGDAAAKANLQVDLDDPNLWDAGLRDIQGR